MLEQHEVKGKVYDAGGGFGTNGLVFDTLAAEQRAMYERTLIKESSFQAARRLKIIKIVNFYIYIYIYQWTFKHS
jgi:hypothetical protein